MNSLGVRVMRLLPITMCVLVGVYAPPASAGRGQRRAAKASYRSGLKLLAKGKRDQAIEKLKIALALGGNKAANYYIGVAYEGKGDLKQAKYYLETFVKAVRRHRKRRDALARIKKIKTKLEEAAKPPPEPPPKEPPPDKPPPTIERPVKPPPKPRVVVPPPKPQHDDSRRAGMSGLRVVGFVTMGVGAALLATGGYFAKVSSDKSDEISTLFEQGVTWEPGYDQLYQDGRDAQTNARLLLGIGAGAVITGAVLAILGKPEPATKAVSLSPLPGGAAVSWSCDF